MSFHFPPIFLPQGPNPDQHCRNHSNLPSQPDKDQSRTEQALSCHKQAIPLVFLLIASLHKTTYMVWMASSPSWDCKPNQVHLHCWSLHIPEWIDFESWDVRLLLLLLGTLPQVCHRKSSVHSTLSLMLFYELPTRECQHLCTKAGVLSFKTTPSRL